MTTIKIPADISHIRLQMPGIYLFLVKKTS